MRQPLQKIKTKEKSFDWYFQNANFFRTSNQSNLTDSKDLIKLYKLAAGEFDEEDYNYVTNQLRVDTTNLIGMPAKMRNVPIIPGILNTLMGEKSDRPQNASVIVKNSNFSSEYEKEEFNMVLKSLQSQFVNEYIKNNPDADLEKEPVKSPEVIAKELSSLKDEKAIEGQHVLSYVYQNSEIPRKLRQGFYHWLVSNRVFSYVSLDSYGEIDFEIITPDEIKYIANKNIDFIEDAEVVIRTTKMSGNSIVDNLRDVKDFENYHKIHDLEQSIIDYLDTETATNSFGSEFRNIEFTSKIIEHQEFNEIHQREFKIEHIVWKGYKEFLTISTIDENGEPTIIENVTDDYVLDEYEEVLKRDWKSQLHQIYVIDDRFYVGYGELDRVRTKMGNDSKLKLPYNGRIMSNGITPLKSLVELAEPFQIKYNILHYQIEKLLNKNKDKIMTFPIQLIPDKEGFDIKTTMYYAEANSLLFVDASDSKSIQALNALKSIDMSLGNYIENLMQLADYFKNQLESMFGITAQRKGNITQSAGKGVTEEAIYRGSIASEEMFKQYEEYEQRVGQSILDMAKLAYNEGLKSSYISSDAKITYFQINSESFAESEFGVFFDNSKKTKSVLESLRQNAQAFAQNQMKPSMLGKLALIDDIPELLRELEYQEDQLEKQQQAQAQAEQENEQRLQDKKDEVLNKQIEIARYKVDRDNDTKIQINLDNIEKDLIGMDANDNDISDALEIQNSSFKREEMLNKVSTDRQKLILQKQMADEKNNVERYKADTSLKIAKENKNKYNK